MPLKYKYQKQADVPAEHAPFYVEREGVFVLDAEGAVDKAKLDEFRHNNIALQNQLKSFDGLDAAKAREWQKKEQELAEGELLKKGDVGALIESKLAPLKTDLARERERNVQLMAQIESGKLTEAIHTTGTKAGVRPTALPDLQARAARAFKVVDGQVVAAEAGMTLDGWLEALKAEALIFSKQIPAAVPPGTAPVGLGSTQG